MSKKAWHDRDNFTLKKCEHIWKYVGMDTVSDPVALCHACPKCKYFKFTRFYDERSPDKDGEVMTEVYTDVWPHGPWDWNNI